METQKIVELTTGELVQAFFQNTEEPADTTGLHTFASKILTDGKQAKIIVVINNAGTIQKLK